MATIYKVLGQDAPSATTLSTLYTVPAATSAVCSTLVIANRGVSTPFRIAVQPGGASITNSQYIVYDATLNANDTLFLTLGITLATTDVISVYAGTADTSFSLFGSEIT
jgi:hypothetical protein